MIIISKFIWVYQSSTCCCLVHQECSFQSCSISLHRMTINHSFHSWCLIVQAVGYKADREKHLKNYKIRSGSWSELRRSSQNITVCCPLPAQTKCCRYTIQQTGQVKVKVLLDNFCPVVFDSRGWCTSPFPSHRASVCTKTIFHGHVASATQTRNAVTFPLKWSLLIYLHLHAFEPLGWRGAGTSNGSSFRRMDSIL